MAARASSKRSSRNRHTPAPAWATASWGSCVAAARNRSRAEASQPRRPMPAASYASSAAVDPVVTWRPWPSCITVILRTLLALQHTGEPGDGVALRPRSKGPRRPVEEADVAAVRDELDLNLRRQRVSIRQRVGWYEGIVERVDEQGRAPDVGEIRFRARARPVIALVGKAVERRGERAVVLGERVSAQHRRHVDEAGIEAGLRADLGLQRAQEVGRVDDARKSSIEDTRAGGEVVRRRDGDGADELGWRSLAVFPEPLEEHVPA